MGRGTSECPQLQRKWKLRSSEFKNRRMTWGQGRQGWAVVKPKLPVLIRRSMTASRCCRKSYCWEKRRAVRCGQKLKPAHPCFKHQWRLDHHILLQRVLLSPGCSSGPPAGTGGTVYPGPTTQFARFSAKWKSRPLLKKQEKMPLEISKIYSSFLLSGTSSCDMIFFYLLFNVNLSNKKLKFCY